MTEVLYYIFIYPMQTLLGAVFEWLHSLTSSYGISIILLSLLINFFLLRLTQISERKAKAIDILKNICDEKIKEFKRVFKGAELHTYTRTLFKQKHYHPIYNIFSLGGLALQIPFFLGVLFLLQDLEALKGARFFIIKDLSKPDTLVFGYALLPYIMSALSLVNVFMSSKEMGARLQGSVIALIFLVLLYVMPSGLVLYWTTSMAFSLVRTLLNRIRRDSSLGMQCDGFSKLREARTPSVLTSENLLKTAHGHTANARILDSAKTLDSINPESSNIIKSITDSYQGFANSHSCRGIKRTYKSFLLLLKQIIHSIFTPHKDLDSKTYKTYRNISIFALLNIFFLIFVFSPYAIYSSDVSQFDSTQTFQTLGGLFGFFLLFSFLGIYITSFFYKTRLLKLGVYGVSVILVIGIVYSFVLDYNVVAGERYPAMENMMFLTSQNMHHWLNKYIDLLIGILLCLFALIIFLKAKKIFLVVLKIAFIAFTCSSLIYGYIAIPADRLIVGIANDKHQTTKQTLNPNENLVVFSKNNLNIVVLMLDAFTGSHLKILLENNPNLRQQLDGFVYYDNTTTASSFTFTSLPSVFGGDYYSAYQINKRMPENLNNERAMAIANISNAFLTRGFKVGVDVYAIDKNFVDAQIAPKYKSSFIFTRDDAYYIDLFERNHNFNLSVLREEAKHIFILDSFIAYGVFKFSPYTIRMRVLNAESLEWNIQFGATKSSMASISQATQHIAQLSYFADLAVLDFDNYPTLKLVSNLTSHDSFVLDIDSCKPSLYTEPQLPDFYRNVIPKIFWSKYNSEVCAFREIDRFITKLKSLGVYDNMLFVIVSDHGRDDSYPQLKLVGKNKFPGYYTDTLLLVKKPNTRGELTIDSRLMINSDVAGIICQYIGGCPNVAQSVISNYPQNREVIHFYPEFFEGHKHPKTHYKMHSLWKVKDNIFNPANWTNITDSKDSKESSSIQNLQKQ